jgi:hypothetical protein
MTWCSVDSATPRFALASAAIRCRFVDRFARLKVLSRVSRQRFSSRGASHPSVGSRRVRFPAVVSTMKALRLPARAFPVTYLVRFRAPHVSPNFVLAFTALPFRWRTGTGPGTFSTGCPRAGLLSYGRERDLSGSQTIRPVPLPRSKTPAEPTIPRQWRSRRCCPRSNDSEGFGMRSISRLLRGFSTCCLRFKNGVAAIPARLASGWLAGLCREGVEPPGSQ